MLRNKNTYKKIRNILVLIMAIGIIFGIYKYIEQSRAEDIILVKAVAIDNYGYIENEEFDLEAKKIEDNLYEIELPETINTKKIAEISNIMLKDAQDQKTIVKIEDNKIYLTDDQVKKQEIDINAKYDVAILKEQEDNTYEKILLLGKNESERKTIIQDEEIITLYNKILKYEDSDNNKIVELKGYLPENAEIEVKEVTQEQITQIFGENNAKVKVAYDIKILQKVITKLPENEREQGNESGEIEETIEIKPEDFDEVCEVSIKDLNIVEKSKVYHVKEDNTFEQVNVTENTEGNISFEAKTFSIYAVSDGEIEPDPGGETGASCNPWIDTIKLQQPGESDYTQYKSETGNVSNNYLTVPYGTIFGGATGSCNNSPHNSWAIHGSALLNDKPWNGIQAPYINGTASSVLPSVGYVLDVGVWKFHWVCTVQGAGGGNRFFVTVIDPPKVTVSIHNCDWRRTTLSVTLKVTTTSTWATTNSYQYYISTSESNLTGGSWITYTADTDNTINLGGTTGIYYLYVKKVLNSDNSVSEVVDADDYSVDTTINGVVYHRFGPYCFDYTEPEKGTFSLSKYYTNQPSVTLYIADPSDAHSGIDRVQTQGWYVGGDGSRKYVNATYDSVNNRYYATFSFADIPNASTGEGKYGFSYHVYDKAGNSKAGDSTWVIYDTTAPTISVSPTSCSWRNSALSVTITATDPTSNGSNSGLSTSNSYQYYLSNSATALSGGTWTTYTSGTAISLNPGTSGTYYLFVKRVNDRAGNTSTTSGTSTTISGTTYQRFGAYQFDYTKPTISVSTTSCTWRNSALSPTITVADTGGSGLSTSNSYQYYLSNSATALSGGAWTTYTSGTAISLNPGTTGTYYLFVKRVNDNAGNTSTTSGTATEISGETYQRFGAYQFDYTKPTEGSFSVSAFFTNQSSVTLFVIGPSDADSGIDYVRIYGSFGKTGSYSLINTATYNSTTDRYYATFSFADIPNRSTGEVNQGEGTYSFWYSVVDKAGNINSPTNRADVVYDYTSPVIEVSTTACKWRNSAINTTITVSDTGGAGLSTSNTYQYYLSNSATALAGGSWQSYSSGNEITLNPGTSGTYYLFIKRISDNAGNASTTKGTSTTISGTTYQRFGAYQFDYSKPTISVSTASCTWRNSAINTTITVTESGGSGLSTSNSYQYYLSNSSTVLSGGSWQDYTSGTAVSLNPGASGTYYLFVKRVNDNAENTSTANGTATTVSGTTYQRFGAYQFDYTKPRWEISNVTTDQENGRIIVEILGKDDESGISSSGLLLTTNTIGVYVNGIEPQEATKTLSSPTIVSNNEVKYTLTLSNITFSEGDDVTFTPTETIVGGTAKYRSQGEGSISIKITAGTLKDQVGNSSDELNTKAAEGADTIGPQIYEVQKTQNASAKTETIIFNVTDKYYNASDILTTSEIIVSVDGVQATSIAKSLTYKEIKANVEGTVKTLGHQYTLVLSNIAESTKQTGKSYLEWSGTLQVKLADQSVKDLNGNNINTATTISDFVDYIKPEIEKITVTNPINTTNKTYTMSFKTIDKYIDTTKKITESDIKVYIDGEEATSISKKLTSTAITATVNKTINGSIVTGSSQTVGYTYTLVLSNFEQSTKQSGKSFKEWSGTVKIEIAQNSVSDTSENTLASAVTLTGEHVDFIKPVIERVSSTVDSTAKTQTITFNVFDKYLDTSKELATNEVTIYVDGQVATGITKTVTKGQNFTTTVNGDSTHIVGQQYQVVLSGFEQSTRSSGDYYKNWSGTVSIEIAQTAFKDTSSNTLISDSVSRTVQGEFVDFLKPEFTYKASTTTIGNGNNGNTKKVTVLFDVVDKYFSSTNLATDTNASKITVKVANTEINATINASKTLTKKNIIVRNTLTNAITYNVADYTLSTNESKIGERYELVVQGLEQLDSNGLSNGYSYSGPMSIAFPSKIITDNSSNQNDATTITIGVDEEDGNANTTAPSGGDIVDVVAPTWELGAVSLENGTIKLRAIDKYFSTCTLAASSITVYVNGVESTAVVKDVTSTAPTNITDTVDGKANTVVGKEYTLQLSNLTTGGSYVTFTPTTTIVGGTAKYRGENGGEISIKIAAGTIKDQSGNTSREQSFEIGNMDSTLPEVYEVQKTKNASAKTETIIFNVTDRNYDPTDLVEASEITVYVDGVQVSGITKELTSKEIKANIDETTKILGHQYTLVLSNIVESTKQSEKSYLEWSGTLQIKIAANASKDLNGNTLNTATTVIDDFIDFIKPEIEKVTVTNPINTTNKTYTMSFKTIDKYIDTTKKITESDIKVYVDGEEATSITKTLTSTEITSTINKTVNGSIVTGSPQIIGYTYTLVLGGFEQSSKQTGKSFKEWSGTVKIEIAQNSVSDTSENTLASAVTLTGEYVDFIQPTLEYTHQDANINTEAKTYTMTFEVIDKYYASGEITIDDLTILMKNGQKDSSGNEIVYNLKNEPVTIFLRKTNKTATFNKTVNGTVANGTYVIGHTYTLTISNLEHLEIKSGHNTADYSGIVTVAVTGNKIQDEKSNKNIGTTITSGVDIPGGTVSSDALAVDVVRPIFTKLSSTASAIDPTNKASSTATITFKGTDTYFKTSTLTANDIKVIVNGIEATGVSKMLNSKTDLKEDRIVNGTNTSGIKYGEEYVLTLNGFAQDANQVKIRIPAGVLTDETGNTNAETDLIVYNVLIKTDTEGNGTSPFLVNSVITRQNIQKIIFKSNLTDINTNNAFDVSAQQDGSIMAWYNETSAPYTVYIGSNDEIFANPNSTYLFAYIASSSTSKATTAIENLNLLNVKSVTNMKGMFESFGSTAMTTLTLPTTFDTSNVTDMSNMFYSCGYTAMTSLNLGANFITNNVTGMSYMFNSTGYTKMTSLNLGSQFNTSQVRTMLYMFNATGHEAMTSLNLGNLFDTSSVTSMVSMFEECGYKAMTVLNLGNSFDTQNVTNMNRMFMGCGHTAMTSLELGDKFDTKKVTNMNNMFNGCGTTAMTVLDLGPAFTNISESCQDFITNCGTTNLIIYAGEAIYSDKTAFRIYY